MRASMPFAGSQGRMDLMQSRIEVEDRGRGDAAEGDQSGRQFLARHGATIVPKMTNTIGMTSAASTVWAAVNPCSQWRVAT
jgi:hypothetical protein